MGTYASVYDPRMIDHAQGVELQLVEAVERRDRMARLGRADELRQLDAEVRRLQDELARTADRLAS